ncbi:methyltransferase domain-containing protein [Parvularcula sp. ZS-1/3]|uniref:Methyltransferase domain-containing protein n=1 Tax=Parvularcula mediterranea TaxID=2732508 RepID=A0A7Y3W586_9PROT|nr:class I SAM-dependent methyltransferase [Parvularcula mediterranea]NNU16359.1 methyltransferase domain-containing protein [Parvularcula mediterranea]
MVHQKPPSVFAPHVRKLRLTRAARNFSEHDFLHRRVAEDALDRLETVQKRFENALFYGPAAPLLAELLTDAADVGKVTIAGESGAFLNARGAADPIEASATALPFEDDSFDLVVSLMSLHAEDDLPGALMEARRVLEPDGLFIGSFPAEQTLMGLRQALRNAEAALTGGVAPRVAPFVQIKDAGALLQRAGFALPVVDVQPVKVRYRQPLTLLKDLRGMGETLALKKPGPPLRRDVLATAMAELEGQETLFEFGVLTGWTPHPSQPKPLKPGSAKASLADAVQRMQDE